jgi:exosortase family protein XrtF
MPKIPGPVLSFFAKALVVFLAWKLAYLLFLQPHRTLDEPLTAAIGNSTVAVLNLFGGQGAYSVRRVLYSEQLDGGTRTGDVAEIYRDEQKTLRIADACNGLELMVLYAGFLFCYPGRPSRRFGFLFGGLALIYLMNVVRCAVLIRIFLKSRQFLDFSHHFAFTFIVYGIIFLLWYLYTRRPDDGPSTAVILAGNIPSDRPLP